MYFHQLTVMSFLERQRSRNIFECKLQKKEKIHLQRNREELSKPEIVKRDAHGNSDERVRREKESAPLDSRLGYVMKKRGRGREMFWNKDLLVRWISLGTSVRE